MGPAAETFLLILLVVALVLGATGWLFRPQIKRAVRYFRDWAERDKREEERARAEKVQREQAEAELREKLVEDDDEPESELQKVNR